MLRIIGCVAGLPGLEIAQAATRAGCTGCVGLEYAKPGEAKRLLDSMVVSGVAFAASIAQLNSDLVDLLGQYAGRGLKQVLLTEPALDDLQKTVSALQRLDLKSFIQVTTLDQALAAQAAGADALIVKGNESGGLVGEETTLILLQRIVPKVFIPVFARGGIGIHTASSCLVIGAAGVVLDWQLALCEESVIPEDVKARVARMDGSETAILGQNCKWRYRVYARPGEAAYFELKELEEKSISLDGNDTELQAWKDAVDARVREGRLLLIGQDAAFAARLASEYRTVKGICEALQSEAFRSLRVARQNNVIDEGAPLATSHGTRFPILQGPMTRVSDRASFALAVAEGGGLPFLALALMRAPQVRVLLQETRQSLGDRPWGIGILGFVPKELREEQLAEVLKVRPPYAIIAGGRPDQAKALEQEGIHTYLHVPSPELLRMFLESGARRVIFEGRECGGHVGPRSSFVLWELMIEIILAHLPASQDRPSDYHIVFAGGIHDAMSAAMVSALAAPLSEKGVRVGVLIGTGYLFTAEAVSSGAIVEGFQREAVACRETILLESGVGHATRCASTPFGQQFADQKRRLLQEGRSKEEIREALEMLNLGRLRIASKALAREPQPGGQANYSLVDEEKQRLEGMYMIGQVAALRDRVCSIEELHQDICRAGGYLQAASERITKAQLASIESTQELRPSVDIAIVGISCVFPKAQDLTSYWQNILNKVSAIEEVPKDRWDVDLYFNKDRRAPDKIYSRWGGFLGPVTFDPVRYGMPPNSVPSVDPLQLLMLELASRALDHAGYSNRPFDRENTSVIVGVGGGVGDLGMGYGFRSLLPHYMTESGGSSADAENLIQDLEHCLPTWTEDSFAGLLLNVVAGRVANRLDLGGTNYTVDAACATSLAAVRLAVNELESRSSNVVIVAGADTMQSPFGYLCFSKTQALSPTGHCHTFDETADGIVISEGVAVAVLKRLEDAIRDGDRVYAVIKSVGASSDGKDKGLTAPRPIGQMRALDRAYAKAEVPPSTVGLMEAHGTGTVVGDRTEVESVTKFFRAAGSGLQSCALGSVKSMIGHTKCTAGMAGLVKAALALYHKVLPPTLGITKPNSKADFPNSPFYLNTEARPWIGRGNETPRRAGVSAFGFGGTNFHAVLQEPPALDGMASPSQTLRDWPAELFLWKAESPDAILNLLEQVSSALSEGAQPLLCELAAAVCWEHSRIQRRHCLAIVATSLDDLKSKMGIAAAAIKKGDSALRDPRGVYYSAEPVAADGKIAFLFPGQGSQRPDMVMDLSVSFPLVREVFEQADASLGDRLGKPLSSFIFPLPVFTDEERNANENALKQTNVAQPAVGAADMAVYRLLSSFGIHPNMVGGHSYGEFVALCAAGSIPFDELIRISEARGRFIIEAAKDELGTMAAIDADEAMVAPVLRNIKGVVIANLNSPQQTVISGTEQGVTEALKEFSAIGIFGRRFPVSCAFHSALVAGAKETLGAFLKTSTVRPPVIPVFSNTTAKPHSIEPDVIREQLSEHLVRPVRFAGELQAMYDAGARVFIEVGPGKVLTGLVDRTLGERNHVAVPMDQPGRHGLVNLVHSLALLATAGIPVRAYHLFDGRVARKLDLVRLVDQTKPMPPTPTAWTINFGKAVPANGAKRKPKQIAAHADANQNGNRPGPNESAAKATSPSAIPSIPEPAPVALAAPPPAPRVLPAKHPAAAKQPVIVKPRNAGEQRTHPSQPAPVAAPPSNGNGVSKNGLNAAMQGHYQLMAKFLETQKNVMLAYLQSGNGADSSAHQAPVHSAAGHAESENTPVEFAVQPEPALAVSTLPARSQARQSSPEAPAAQTPAAPVVTQELIVARLVALVSERTGYPVEMLNLDLDLEADLGVDSIKRVEILGALHNESALSLGSLEGEIENLSKVKTLRAIAEWILSRAAGQSASPTGAADAAPQPAAARGAAHTPAAPVVTQELVVARLVALVSERTGYPVEMLNLDLDLEADLGVDSIKRVEILGALQNESALPLGSLEGEIENLSKVKTLRAIAEWITARAGAGTSPGDTESVPDESPAESAQAADWKSPIEIPVTRMSVALHDVPVSAEPASEPVSGLVLITDDGAVAPSLAEELRRMGVAGEILDPKVNLTDANSVTKALGEIRRKRGPITALIHLPPWAENRSMDPGGWSGRLDKELKTLFNLIRGLETDMRTDGGRLIVATRMGGSFAVDSRNGTDDFWPGSGAVCGFVKSVAREWPEVCCRVVDFESDATSATVVERLLDELAIAKGTTEAGYQNGVRKALWSIPTPLRDGSPAVKLDRDSVVMITGGARGITAAIALELAGNFRCKLVLAGRSPLPSQTESSLTAGSTDAREQKATLLKQAKEGGQPFTPASIEAAYRKISQEREIRSNLSAMAAAGSVVEYHSVDVTDTAAFEALIEDIYSRHGRIDGVIHGAGVIEDKLLRDKSPESFDRVVKPKVMGALTLMRRLRPESLAFLIFFSSVSARYGNRGQSDYAAANEVLNKLALWLNQRWPGRVLSLNWGPWKTENGMVSSALATHFAKAGVQMIDPAAGQKIFVQELLFGRKEEAEVVWGGPISHEGSPGAVEPANARRFISRRPLLSSSTEFRENADGSVLVLRDTGMETDLYLKDHMLDGKPVMPLAMVLELFAEVAAATNPDKRVTGVCDLKLLRGVSFNAGTRKLLEVHGSRQDETVDLRLETVNGRRELHYTGTIEFGAAQPDASIAAGFELVDRQRLPLSTAAAYERWLFHGPSFAGIDRIEAIGKNGIIAFLKASVPGNLFANKPAEWWLVDPVVIDSGLQLLILWARHYLDMTPLPARLGACRIFGPPATDSIRCEVQVFHQEGSLTLCADLKFFDGSNRLFAMLEDMEVTCSKALNRLGGVYAAALGTTK